MDVPDLLRRAVRRRPPASRASRLDVLESLSDAGCPACRARERAVRRWFRTYEHDTNGDITVRLRMERSLGLCAPHNRQLLSLGAASSWLAKTLYADVAHAGLRLLGGTDAPSGEPCPPCRVGAEAAEGFLDTLAAVAGVPHHRDEVATFYRESEGVCLPHAADLLPRVPKALRPVILAVLRAQLAADPLSAVLVLSGRDADVHRRAGLRRRARAVANAEAACLITSEQPSADFALAAPCCPLCSAAVRAEWRTLTTLAAKADDGADAAGAGSGSPTDSLLCGPHLAALAADGPTDPVAEVVAAAVRDRLAAVDEAAAAVGRAALRGPVRAAVRALRSAPRCVVCERRARAVAAERELLQRLAADDERRPRVWAAHGVCLRHGVRETLPDVWREVLRRRLTALAAELDEARRKDTWEARGEARGPEATAWRRAPALLDGEVDGPAPPPGPA